MGSDNLIRMANSIGDFFESMPDRDEALEATAMHMRKFWVPEMRRQLLAKLDAGGHGASDIVVQAVKRHRAAWPEANAVGR
jgi:formate dehydrogenase subunit delta